MSKLSLLDALEKHSGVSRDQVHKVGGADADQWLLLLDLFIEQGLVVYDPEKEIYSLAEKGAARLKWLMVDYFHESAHLYNQAVDLFRTRLHRLYDEGSRKIALYAAGESADVAYHACKGTGLQIMIVTDDDPAKQGELFQEFEIRSPDELALHDVDTVLITTCAYEDQIYRRIAILEQAGVRVERL